MPSTVPLSHRKQVTRTASSGHQANLQHVLTLNQAEPYMISPDFLLISAHSISILLIQMETDPPSLRPPVEAEQHAGGTSSSDRI